MTALFSWSRWDVESNALGAVEVLMESFRRAQSWPSFRLVPDRTDGRARLRLYLRLVLLRVTGRPAVTDGLDGDLDQLWLDSATLKSMRSRRQL
jgi:hypothetical protein